ncbi:MAG: DUF499 domain-containing protein [Bacteroidetes bacterium]|nr:DUF499 domain-containing protein [Bacteroidota bacterium]
MKPWYKVVTLREEVREGRSFSPDEFAIALEQVVDGTAPNDYCDPAQFFSRTSFTSALNEHAEKVLRRLSGKTENTAPVLTLITQFGGGKTHILTSLYHIAKAGAKAYDLPGISDLLRRAQIGAIPNIQVGVFVGNAWDPTEGNETPWIDLARQIAGEKGVEALGTSPLTVPGTSALSKVFALADAPVLLLFDEVLNFVNRHREMADHFHSFIQNLSVAVTGTTSAVAVISLPRSQVEMTDWDQQWQEKITKVVRRVSEDIFANDESDISEVICRRLFEDRGSVRVRRAIAEVYADWCFQRSDRLPPEWLTVDTALKGARAKEHIIEIFETCYPFHPATLSVFKRKWSSLSQFQQTRGTLAMLAQWISVASENHFKEARNEPLITLGSAPLYIPKFRAVVLGQLGESRLDVAINADIAGPIAHARALDADTAKDLRDIHQRVGAAILFESSGGQVNKVAQLSELRFALGDANVDTTAIDNAANSLESRSFFIRELGGGYKIHHQATLRKVVNDYRASLHVDTEVKPAIHQLIDKEFRRGAAIKTVVTFPEDSSSVQDTHHLILVILDPQMEWSDDGNVKQIVSQWTKYRNQSPRLYPGSLVWCAKSPVRNLREKVEIWLAWKKVESDIHKGILGSDYDSSEIDNVQSDVKQAIEAAKNEVWASYRYVIVSDSKENEGLKVIDLGAGHSSSNETMCGRVITALKSEGLLNENVGAGYIERHWPPALMESGAWPLKSLRKNFLDGSLTRLVNPEDTLRTQIVKFVTNGDFGLASGMKSDGKYRRVWYKEPISLEEVEFVRDVFLLTKKETLANTTEITPPDPDPIVDPPPTPDPPIVIDPTTSGEDTILSVSGTMPSETWSRFGIKVVSKLRSLMDLQIEIQISSKVSSKSAEHTKSDLRKDLNDLGLSDQIKVE